MKEQSYSNHAAWFPMFHFVVLPFLLIYALRAIWLGFQAGTSDSIWSAAFAIVVFLAALSSRVMPLKVQDRLIRLEMRLWLASILPSDLRDRIGNLTPDQLIGLRFACDSELPDLVRRVLAGELKERGAIKKAVRTWEPDLYRA